jgi:uncharacterized membrane protein YqhA
VEDAAAKENTMRKIHPLQAEADTRQRWIPALITVILGLAALSGALYVTANDARYLLTHLNQISMPDLSSEMRTRLEMEIATEAIKVFLDLYLLVVILLVIAPSLYTRFVSKRQPSLVDSIEFAAQMFLTRAADLTKWLIGFLLLRLMIGYFQKLLRLEVERGLDLIYLTLVVLLVGGALMLSHHRVPRR